MANKINNVLSTDNACGALYQKVSKQTPRLCSVTNLRDIVSPIRRSAVHNQYRYQQQTRRHSRYGGNKSAIITRGKKMGGATVGGGGSLASY